MKNDNDILGHLEREEPKIPEMPGIQHKIDFLGMDIDPEDWEKHQRSFRRDLVIVFSIIIAVAIGSLLW